MINAAKSEIAGESEWLLEARRVSVHYGAVRAVNDVSFRLSSGSIFGIVGPNGSGKSTLIAALTRLAKLTSGSLLLDGEEFQRVSPAKVAHLGLARTFQTVRLLPALSVRENVMVGADIRGFRPRRGRDEIERVVARSIQRTGLVGCERKRPTELSYGTQRRVEIARALAMEPRILLLDEPTAGMNQDERRAVSVLLRSLRDEGLTQLLVEHDVQMMVDTCDYLFAMNFGTIIASGAPTDVVREPVVREAYLGRRWRSRA